MKVWYVLFLSISLIYSLKIRFLGFFFWGGGEEGSENLTHVKFENLLLTKVHEIRQRRGFERQGVAR